MNNKTAKDFIEKFNEIVCKDITYNTLNGRMKFSPYMDQLHDITQLVFIVNSAYYYLGGYIGSSISANRFVNAVLNTINNTIKDGDKNMIALKAGVIFKAYARQTGMWTDETQGGE